MKIQSFTIDGSECGVEYVETVSVTAGVTCDIYRFVADDHRDLALVRVASGYRTPRQKVVGGARTIEGHVEGTGTLTVVSADGSVHLWRFPGSVSGGVEVRVGDVMQWHASGPDELTFFEVCTPPYQEGRFEDLR